MQIQMRNALPPRTFNLFAINRYQRGSANSTNQILASSVDLICDEKVPFKVWIFYNSCESSPSDLNLGAISKTAVAEIFRY